MNNVLSFGLGRLGSRGVKGLVESFGGALDYVARHAAQTGEYVARHLRTIVPTSMRVQAEWIMSAITSLISTAYGYITTLYRQSVYENNHPCEGSADENSGFGFS